MECDDGDFRGGKAEMVNFGLQLLDTKTANMPVRQGTTNKTSIGLITESGIGLNMYKNDYNIREEHQNDLKPGEECQKHRRAIFMGPPVPTPHVN